jgi:hypothetical protein
MLQRPGTPIVSFVIMLSLPLTGVTTLAHHSFAAIYDEMEPLRLEGTIEEIAWRNPHVTFTLTSHDSKGVVETWTFEMGAPRVLTEQFGWSVDMLEVGDHVTVEGFKARDRDRQAAAQYVTTQSGRRLLSVRPFR